MAKIYCATEIKLDQLIANSDVISGKLVGAVVDRIKK